MSFNPSHQSASFPTHPNTNRRNNSFSGATTALEGESARTNNKQSCIFCPHPSIPHISSKCSGNMSIQDRRAIAYRVKACFNCLLHGSHPKAHTVKDCLNQNRCRVTFADGTNCNAKHHTLLCYKTPNNNKPVNEAVALPVSLSNNDSQGQA